MKYDAQHDDNNCRDETHIYMDTISNNVNVNTVGFNALSEISGSDVSDLERTRSQKFRRRNGSGRYRDRIRSQTAAQNIRAGCAIKREMIWIGLSG